MAPRVLYVLGVLLCAIVLVSSHVAAGEEPTAASNTKEQKTGEAVDDKQQVPGCGHRKCCMWTRGGCAVCCPASETAADAVDESKQIPGCGWGKRCCLWTRGGCARCCAEGEEAPAEVKAEGEPQN